MLHARLTRTTAFLVFTLTFAMAPPALGIHLFPFAPGDPTSDCGAGLAKAPQDSAAKVAVGEVRFTDEATHSSTTEIQVGDSVTWVWAVPYCHSVTGDGFTTQGGPPTGVFSPVFAFEGRGNQQELVKPEGESNSFTHRFTMPGTYDYSCVHHVSLGMTGKVVVSSAPK